MVAGYRLTSFTGTSFTARASVTNTSTKRFDIRSTIAERLGTFKFSIREIAHDDASFTPTSFDLDSFLTADITTADKTFNFDIRAGSINAHVISHFVLKGGVIRTLTSNISIVGEILKTLTVRVGLLQTVSNILRNKFSIDQQMSNTFSSIFGIRSTVGILGVYTDESFTTNSYTISDLSRRINFVVREEVSETSTGRFDIIAEIVKTLANRFAIRQAVSDTVTTRFDLRQAILKLSNLEFDTLGRIVSTLTNRFRITTTVPVRTLTHQFIIRQKISDVLTGRFDLRQAITKLGTKRFDIRAIIIGLPSFVTTGFTDASFTTVLGAIPQLTSRFRITSDVASSYKIIKFHIRQAITETATTRFDLRQAITDVLSIRIGLAHQLSKNLTNIFNLRQAILETDTTRFDIRTEVPIKTVTAQFIIRQKISDVLSGRFDLKQAIVNVINARFQMVLTASNSIISKFHIKFLMTNTHRVSTKSSSKRVGTTGSSRNVKSL